MQEKAPDILITNISMLNAMLSRSSEQRMLEQTREWLASDERNRFTLSSMNCIFNAEAKELNSCIYCVFSW